MNEDSKRLVRRVNCVNCGAEPSWTKAGWTCVACDYHPTGPTQVVNVREWNQANACRWCGENHEGGPENCRTDSLEEARERFREPVGLEPIEPEPEMPLTDRDGVTHVHPGQVWRTGAQTELKVLKLYNRGSAFLVSSEVTASINPKLVGVITTDPLKGFTEEKVLVAVILAGEL